ncbi:MAG: CDGSH iron-sulfur domain-containing protein [Phycisphaerae bacterium]
MSELPRSAGTRPVIMEILAGKPIWWCSCGCSNNQPCCDGSHKLAAPGYAPVKVQLDETAKVALCLCKKTRNPPYCDGSHK